MDSADLHKKVRNNRPQGRRSEPLPELLIMKKLHEMPKKGSAATFRT
jgi:hypothetical protein